MANEVGRLKNFPKGMKDALNNRSVPKEKEIPIVYYTFISVALKKKNILMKN